MMFKQNKVVLETYIFHEGMTILRSLKNCKMSKQPIKVSMLAVARGNPKAPLSFAATRR